MSGMDIGGLGARGMSPWRSPLRPIGSEIAPPIQDPQRIERKTPGAQEGAAKGFGDLLTGALENVQALQDDTSAKTRGLALGEDVDVHDVMIAAGKSEVAFNLVLEVRNKMVEAWEKLSRSVM
ncbi:MAG: flagellar hook-basal body complex protein FliE [Planctomycetes bacterium]|nr:flagellar hook-basal body complex protein FliE [Planctomycetota bacterium]